MARGEAMVDIPWVRIREMGVQSPRATGPATNLGTIAFCQVQGRWRNTVCIQGPEDMVNLVLQPFFAWS